MHGRKPLLGSQESHRSSPSPEAKLGGIIIIGLLVAQAVVAEDAEAKLESAEAELEMVKLHFLGLMVGHGERALAII